MVTSVTMVTNGYYGYQCYHDYKMALRQRQT